MSDILKKIREDSTLAHYFQLGIDGNAAEIQRINNPDAVKYAVYGACYGANHNNFIKINKLDKHNITFSYETAFELSVRGNNIITTAFTILWLFNEYRNVKSSKNLSIILQNATEFALKNNYNELVLDVILPTILDEIRNLALDIDDYLCTIFRLGNENFINNIEFSDLLTFLLDDDVCSLVLIVSCAFSGGNSYAIEKALELVEMYGIESWFYVLLEIVRNNDLFAFNKLIEYVPDISIENVIQVINYSKITKKNFTVVDSIIKHFDIDPRIFSNEIQKAYRKLLDEQLALRYAERHAIYDLFERNPKKFDYITETNLKKKITSYLRFGSKKTRTKKSRKRK